MKNFYDLTVIRPELKLDLRLELTPLGSLPCTVKINNQIYYSQLISEKTIITSEIPITDPIEIDISINRQHPEAIELFLSIDSIEILPKYQNLANPPSCYLDSNNGWRFKIPSFYPWLHEVTGQGWIA